MHEDDEGPAAPVPTTFIFEVVERANDRLLDRIDALDAFLGVLMTAVLAVVLLAIDRFRLIGWYPDVYCGWTSIATLAASFVVIVLGWLRGLRSVERDAPIPSRFIWGAITQGEEALVRTIQSVERSFSSNLPIRVFKRNMAVLALALLTLGTVAAGVAKVVYLTNVSASKLGAEGTSERDGTGGAHRRTGERS